MVRPRCPGCGARRLRTYGSSRGVRYLACPPCGTRFRGVEADPDELSIDGGHGVPDGVDQLVDLIDDETIEEARRSLSGWRARLACHRPERRVAAGLDPLDSDLSVLRHLVGSEPQDGS